MPLKQDKNLNYISCDNIFIQYLFSVRKIAVCTEKKRDHSGVVVSLVKGVSLV
jgi:hypothetical protein